MSAPDIAVIIAAGNGSRWNDHLGVPKHLVTVEGEPILYRTVRLLLQHISEVWVIAAPGDPRYRNHDGHTLTVEPNDSDMDKFYSSRRLWQGRHAVIAYGDVYFTEQAIVDIVQPVEEWTLYCRPEASEHTGSPWGECFAYSVPVEDQAWFTDRIEWLAGMNTLGVIGRVGGWELYRSLLQQHPGIHEMTTHHHVIDDNTDDFDYPSDYDVFLAKTGLPQ